MATAGEIYSWTDSNGGYYEYELVAVNSTAMSQYVIWNVKCISAPSSNSRAAVGSSGLIYEYELGTKYPKVVKPAGSIVVKTTNLPVAASIIKLPVTPGDVYREDVSGNSYTYCVTGSGGKFVRGGGAPVNLWYLICVTVQSGGSAPLYQSVGGIVCLPEDVFDKTFSTYLGNNQQMLTRAAQWVPTNNTTQASYGTVVFSCSTPPEAKPAKTCKCNPDHPHNERGCYFGMCGCRVAK